MELNCKVMSSLIQTQSSKILSTTRGSCHARHVSLHRFGSLLSINRACFRGGWSGITPAERFFGAFFAIRLIGRSCREEGAEASFRLRNTPMLPISLWALE
uniref:Uncharacterized protein n=1 Tax=Wuchereria bancrofti TaxID=6293 RepID=A0AAF5Q0E2_WUCBA